MGKDIALCSSTGKRFLPPLHPWGAHLDYEGVLSDEVMTEAVVTTQVYAWGANEQHLDAFPSGSDISLQASSIGHWCKLDGCHGNFSLSYLVDRTSWCVFIARLRDVSLKIIRLSSSFVASLRSFRRHSFFNKFSPLSVLLFSVQSILILSGLVYRKDSERSS